MHEMSIAIEIMGQLEALAAEHNIQRIQSLTIAAGVMRGVVPEALDIAFESAAVGTPAEGARLQLEFTDALARCRLCGLEFTPKVDSFLCMRCNQADVDIVEGNDIVLKTVEGQSA